MTASREPIFDIAQLAHIEILTPDLDGSAGFFKDLLGLQETERHGDSIYLRGFEESYHHSLKLTAAPRPGLGHVAWRASSPPALERRVTAIEASGQGRGWSEGDRGHGRAFQFELPEGHRMEVLWDVDYYKAPADQRTGLINRPQRRPRAGIGVRRIDHFNILAADPRASAGFLIDVLGARERERVVTEDGAATIASFLAFTNLTHDLAVLLEPAPMRGRLHHVCFFLGSMSGLYELAEMARDDGLTIETGPGRHGVGQTMFLYITEPGGNRIEVIADDGFLIFDPSWETVVWNAARDPNAAVWVGGPLPWSMWNQGTPPADIAEPRMVPAKP